MDDTAWLRILATSWRELNRALFRDGLKPAALQLDDSRTRLAAWERTSRTITVSRGLLTRPWPVVIEVLKHEMAHQYAHEVLGAVDETAHGPAFRKVCAERGIDASAAGTPAEQPAETRVLERIRKLLALASSPELHEAESAARMAQRMLLEHHLSEDDVAAEPTFAVRHVGRAASRFMAHERFLAGLLGQYFFVHCIWVQAVLPDGRTGRMLEICGRPEDVAVAEHVHAWLLETGDRLWRARQRAGRANARGRGRFLAGVVAGFAEQCAAEERVCEETGLVRVEQPELVAFVHRRHRHLRRRSGRGVPMDPSFRAGREAGRSVKLRAGVGRRDVRQLGKG